MTAPLRLLWFNLATDADATGQGFTTDWLNALAPHCDQIDVLTMRAGRLALDDKVRVYSVGKEKGYTELRRAVEFYRLLSRLLRENDYDACFAHMQPLFAVMGAPLLLPRRRTDHALVHAQSRHPQAAVGRASRAAHRHRLAGKLPSEQPESARGGARHRHRLLHACRLARRSSSPC